MEEGSSTSNQDRRQSFVLVGSPNNEGLTRHPRPRSSRGGKCLQCKSEVLTPRVQGQNLAPSRQTLLDEPVDGRGISEPSSTKLRTPGATPPVKKTVYLTGALPAPAESDGRLRTRFDPEPPAGST